MPAPAEIVQLVELFHNPPRTSRYDVTLDRGA